MIYGYMRVSTQTQARDGNSLADQERLLRDHGAEIIVADTFTGASVNRPNLKKLLRVLRPNDTLVVAKLDRLARNTTEGIALCEKLLKKNINVKILNLGTLDQTPTGRLLLVVMLGFAEFERATILQRTQAGKAIARQRPDYREGRPERFTDADIRSAAELLRDHTYAEVKQITGISKSTLIRRRRRLGI